MLKIVPPTDRREQNGGLGARIAVSQRESVVRDSKHLHSNAWAALPGTEPVALEHVRGCHWPIGNDLPFTFCNAPISTGVYCATHNQRSMSRDREATK